MNSKPRNTPDHARRLRSAARCLVLAAAVGVGASACDRGLDQRLSEADKRVIARRIKEARQPLNVAEVQSFFAAQEARASRGAASETDSVAREVWPFFTAARAADWRQVSRLYYAMSARSYQFESPKAPDPQLASLVWQPINESFRFYEQCANGSPRHTLDYGREILASLPVGAVLFAGTDPSRFVVTGLCRDHHAGAPVFVISQNALADGLYQQYLATNVAPELGMLTPADSQQAFSDYIEDAGRRLDGKQLKPDEDVKRVEGRLQVSGAAAVMEINARLARRLFERNPRREFFVVEGYRLDWMQPLLEPHGFVLRVRREPVNSLDDAIIARDREFWATKCKALLGDWLDRDTPVETICAFAEKVFVQRDLRGFTGDKEYITSGQPWRPDPPYTSACLTYAHARVSAAGIYERLAREAPTQTERQQMVADADLAYRQALALCAYSPEGVLRYVNFLSASSRWQEARAVIQIGARLNPKGIGPFVDRVEAQAMSRAGDAVP